MNNEILTWINKQIRGYKDSKNRLEKVGYDKGALISKIKENLENLEKIKKELLEKDKLEQAMPKPILDDVEKRYLKNVIRPFQNKVDFVILVKNTMFLEQKKNVRIKVHLIDHDFITLPFFKEGEMYKAMEPNVKYTLKDLGIKYE